MEIIIERIEFHQSELSRLRAMLPDVDFQGLINTVCSTAGIKPYQVQDRSRYRKIVDARMIVSKELRKFGFSLVSIGSILERHHSTVHYWLNRYDDLYQYDNDFRALADACADNIEEKYQPQFVQL